MKTEADVHKARQAHDKKIGSMLPGKFHKEAKRLSDLHADHRNFNICAKSEPVHKVGKHSIVKDPHLSDETHDVYHAKHDDARHSYFSSHLVKKGMNHTPERIHSMMDAHPQNKEIPAEKRPGIAKAVHSAIQ